MSLASTCPACGKSISIPLRGRPQSRVRCPLCAGEFLLEDALKLAPPPLELLDEEDALANPLELFNMGMVSEPAAIAAAAAGTALSHATDDTNEEDDLKAADLYDPLDDEIGLDLTEQRDPEDAAGDAQLASAAENFDDLASEAPEAEMSEDDFNKALTDADAATEQADDPFAEFDTPAPSDDLEEQAPVFGEAVAESAGEQGGDDAGMFDEASDEAAPKFGAASAAAKRRRKEPSAIGTLIGVVGGGVVGTALAYFIVLWIGGPEKDFLEMGRKLPKWMVPAAFHQPASRVATPFAATPSNDEIATMRQSTNDSDPPMKINVPELDPSNTASNDKLPFATEEEDDSSSATNTDDALANEVAGGGASTHPKPADDLGPASPDDMLEDLAGSTPLIEPVMPADLPTTKQPTDATATASDAADDLPDEFGDSELETEDTAAVPLTLPNAPEYSPADFQKALTDVVAAKAELTAKDGDTSADARKLKMQFYRNLYRLAEVLTFMPSLDTQSADSLLTELAADNEMHTEIGKAGMSWFKLDPAKRKSDHGIVLIGKIDDISTSGGATILHLTPAGDGTPVTVVVPRKMSVQAGKSYLIFGTLVENASKTLPQLSLDKSTVIWLGDALKVDG